VIYYTGIFVHCTLYSIDITKRLIYLRAMSSLLQPPLHTETTNYHAEKITMKQKTMSQLTTKIMSTDVLFQLAALKSLRKMLAIPKDLPPIQQVIDSDILLPRVIALLQNTEHPTMQFEAAWILTNIVSGTSDQVNTVIDLHQGRVIPILVQLLSSSPQEDVKEQVLWALGNISGDSPKTRNLVLAANVLEPLLQYMQQEEQEVQKEEQQQQHRHQQQPPPPAAPPNSSLSHLRTASWVLSNLCRGNPSPSFDLLRPALPILKEHLSHWDEEVLSDACWSISYLSADGGSNTCNMAKIDAIIKSGITMRLVELLVLTHPSSAVQTSTLRAIGNIVTASNDVQTRAVVHCSCCSMMLLPWLLSIIVPSSIAVVEKHILKEVCWIISNIAAGDATLIQDVMEAQLIPPLVGLLTNAAVSFDIKKECGWAIANCTKGSSREQIEYLVICGCIPALCDLLYTAEDNTMVIVALEGLTNILKAGELSAVVAVESSDHVAKNAYMYVEEVTNAGGVDIIIALKEHDDGVVNEMALQLSEQYFGSGRDEGGSDDEVLQSLCSITL